MLRLQLSLVCFAAAAVAGSAGAASDARITGQWSGTYRLHGPGSVTFLVGARSAVVALGYGHADAQTVPATTTGSHIRFALPGRPAPLVFAGRRLGRSIRGTVRQGSVRGTFAVTRGSAAGLLARGTYTVGSRTLAVVDDQYGPARVDDLDSGEVHGLYRHGSAFDVGSGFATREPVAGTLRLGAAGGTILGGPARREPLRQLEVRFPTRGATLSGTLTLPAGQGPFPAVAFVHGSGATKRAYLPELSATLVHDGVAVLNYDKRGVGQSGGEYPGESPTNAAIDVLARDAEAAVRFLAAQPEIDSARTGLAGHSQGGWIMPLAASRGPAVHFLLVFSGPTVTADENDAYQNLTGEGDRPQTLSDAAVDAEVLRRGPGGFDPMPFVRGLRIPAIWFFGALDKHIPPRLSAQRLEPLLHDHDFEVAVFPKANHALVETTTGLTSEMLRSDRFAPGLFARIATWLRGHGL